MASLLKVWIIPVRINTFIYCQYGRLWIDLRTASHGLPLTWPLQQLLWNELQCAGLHFSMIHLQEKEDKQAFCVHRSTASCVCSEVLCSLLWCVGCADFWSAYDPAYASSTCCLIIGQRLCLNPDINHITVWLTLMSLLTMSHGQATAAETKSGWRKVFHNLIKTSKVVKEENVGARKAGEKAPSSFQWSLSQC